MNASDPIRNQSKITLYSDPTKTVMIDIAAYKHVSITIDVTKIIRSIVN